MRETDRDEPLEAEQVQLAPRTVAGTVSVTRARLTASGPEFETWMLHVTPWPGTTLEAPLVFVTERSAVCATAFRITTSFT